MSKPKATSAATVEGYFCDDTHLHIEMKNGDGGDIADIALDLDDALEFVQGILSDLEEMTGLVFAVFDPDEVDEDEDTIGPTVGNA